jgi:hypothetical protein
MTPLQEINIILNIWIAAICIIDESRIFIFIMLLINIVTLCIEMFVK